MSDDVINILVVDDHPLLREGIASLISFSSNLKVIAEAKDGVEAVEKARTLKPDVILMDLVMPRKGGIDAIVEIMEEDPKARILVLTSFTDDENVFAAIRAGALGYLLKDSDPDNLLQGIYDVSKGNYSLHPNIARKLVEEVNIPREERQQRNQPSKATSLTDRELEVLQLAAQGMTNKEIANMITISQATVRSHISSILSKLHLANRTQAVLHALREGWAELEE